MPKGQVKLVADPGRHGHSGARAGVSWSGSGQSDRWAGDYFAEPPTVRVPFAGEDGKPVEADVEYAYCLADYQCLFGETKVSVLSPTCRRPLDAATC